MNQCLQNGRHKSTGFKASGPWCLRTLVSHFPSHDALTYTITWEKTSTIISIGLLWCSSIHLHGFLFPHKSTAYSTALLKALEHVIRDLLVGHDLTVFSSCNRTRRNVTQAGAARLTKLMVLMYFAKVCQPNQKRNILAVLTNPDRLGNPFLLNLEPHGTDHNDFGPEL